MAIQRKDMGIAVALGLFLLGGKKVLASSPARRKGESPDDAAADGAHLVERANQATALAWVPAFMGANVQAGGVPVHITEPLAHAYARWAGIESSGVPTTSRIDERGLMQVGPHLGGPDTTPPPPAFNEGQWAQLSDPDTAPDTQADWAIHYVDWLYGRARKHLTDAPTDPLDQVWYAKLYHQRPVDVRDGKLHGPAIPMARELAKRWAADPKAMHRLRAANVVAWGTPTP